MGALSRLLERYERRGTAPNKTVAVLADWHARRHLPSADTHLPAMLQRLGMQDIGVATREQVDEVNAQIARAHEARRSGAQPEYQGGSQTFVGP